MNILLIILFIPFVTIPIFLKLLKWRRARKGGRPPFSDLLLRSPGYRLGREIQDISDDLSAYLLIMCVLPVYLYVIYLYVQSVSPAKWNFPGFWIAVGSLMIWMLWKTYFLLERRRALRIGMAGEVATAEELNRLMLDGFHVYHDFPADRFNIDHILIGASGVFAVETVVNGQLPFRSPWGRPAFPLNSILISCKQG